jgi:hypothetical protein
MPEVNLGPLDQARRFFGLPTLNEQMIAERKAAEAKAAAELEAARQAAAVKAAQEAGGVKPTTGESIQQNRAGGTAFTQVMSELERQEAIRRYNAGLGPMPQ